VNSTHEVNLVGIESFYSENFPKPDMLSAGSPGYAHSSANYGLWSSSADRFAGAILIAEYLGSSIDKIRQSAYGETYFAQDEIGSKESQRFDLLRKALGDIDKNLAELFKQAWFSQTLDECPKLQEWYLAINNL
jgi:hypothetical protein